MTATPQKTPGTGADRSPAETAGSSGCTAGSLPPIAPPFEGRLRRFLLRYRWFMMMFAVLAALAVICQLTMAAPRAAAHATGGIPGSVWPFPSLTWPAVRNCIVAAFLIFFYCYALYNTRIILINEFKRFLLTTILIGLEFITVGLVLLQPQFYLDCRLPVALMDQWWAWAALQAAFAMFLALPTALAVNLIDQRFAFATAIFEAMIIMVQVDLPGENFKYFYYAAAVATVAVPCFRKIASRSDYMRGATGMLLCIAIALPLLNLEQLQHFAARNGVVALLSFFVPRIAAAAAAAGFITAILCYNAQWIFEFVFDLTTPTRLAELHSNTELMRRMRVEAPGTYAHVNAVADLSVNAAAEIGANTDLVSAMALYHDIGKLEAPQYYAENQRGQNPHDKMTPAESAARIIRHVDYGLMLAKQYHLSKLLWSAIETHHGNSVVRHFYNLACRQAEEQHLPPPSERDFQYHHRRPVTREEVIVSLADACEAAVRALLNPDQRDRQVLQQTLRTAQAEQLENPAASFEQVEARCLKELQRNEEQVIHRIQERVRSIFQSRMAEGQLDMAQVTTAELYKISNSFVTTLKFNQHTRPEYLR